jgi:DNA-binding CsgD family transcriptional regulator
LTSAPYQLSSIVSMEMLSCQDWQDLSQSIQELYTLSDLNTFGAKALLIVNQQLRHSAYPIADFIKRRQLQNLDDLYQQFLALLDIDNQVVAFLSANHWSPESDRLAGGEPSMGVSLQQFWPSTSERDRLVLDVLQPHLLRAYRNACQYQQLEQTLNQLQKCIEHLGLITFDAVGQVHWMTPAAFDWLETYFDSSGGAFELPDRVWSWVQLQLLQGKSPDPAGANGPLQVEHRGKKLVIRLVVEPLGEDSRLAPSRRYALLLEEQALPGLKCFERFGLSQREAEVLGCLMQGQDNKAIAAQLGLNAGTIRKHLENIYQKLGVQSRTQALAHVVKSLGLLHDYASR